MTRDILLFDMGAWWRTWFATDSQTETLSAIVDKVDLFAKFYNCVIVCADSPSNWRHRITAHLDRPRQYKARRPPKAPEAVLALLSTEDRLESIGYPVVKVDGYEADDVIAALASQANGRNVHIYSEDKDLFQLINDTTMQITKAGEIDAAACERKFGVQPSRVADYLALVGDNADNIAGCPSVGAKKAVALLAEFGSINEIKKRSKESLVGVKGVSLKIADSILAWDHTMATKLVSLAVDCPVRLSDILTLYSAQSPEEEELGPL